MAWEQLAQALGGRMIAGVLALPVHGIALWKLPPRALFVGSAAAALATAPLIAIAHAL